MISFKKNKYVFAVSLLLAGLGFMGDAQAMREEDSIGERVHHAEEEKRVQLVDIDALAAASPGDQFAQLGFLYQLIDFEGLDDTMIGVAEVLKNSKDANVQKGLTCLFVELARRERVLDCAEGMASCLQDSPHIDVQVNILALLGQLVEQGRAYDCAEYVAGRLQDSDDLLVRENCLSLLKVLVFHERAYILAAQVVRNLGEDLSRTVAQQKRLEILLELCTRVEVRNLVDIVAVLTQSKDNPDEKIQKLLAKLRTKLGL